MATDNDEDLLQYVEAIEASFVGNKKTVSSGDKTMDEGKSSCTVSVVNNGSVTPDT